jgi:hypothetical protein
MGPYVVWRERKASSSDSNVTDETRARQEWHKLSWFYFGRMLT